MTTVSDVLNFWFQELTPAEWFKKDLSLDKKIADRFVAVLERIVAGECADWRGNARGVLAQIIVLDQFSRNIYRDTPQSFAQDSLALAIAQDAVRLGLDKELSIQERAFLYMPYMHSESVRVHEEAMVLFALPGLENNLDFEIKHKVIIDRFGRYPHRNAVLGRKSTPEEIEFLKQPNSSF